MKSKHKFEIRKCKYASFDSPYCIRITNLLSNSSTETTTLSKEDLYKLVATITTYFDEGKHHEA